MTAARFFARLALVYVVTVTLIVLAISPYFSAGWDPQIFAGVGRAVIDNNSVFDLYQVSRQAWGDWGFPYPPLYPHLLAPFMGMTSLVPVLPDWLIVRALPVMFDLALALLLYLIVLRRSGKQSLARLAAALWLFNPLTLYQTAIQAHQESSWLVCVVAAYALIEARRQAIHRRSEPCNWLTTNLVLPSLLMACAVTLKQSAILFYIPYGVFLLLDQQRRWARLCVAALLFVLVFGGLSLPYYLHSPDFFYLVFVDVSNMPVQTQSAVVWLLGLSRYLIDQTQSTFFLLKYQTVITIALAVLVSFFALRHDKDMFRVGLLVAMIFFLTSKKVMGYHYLLLMPFLLVYALPARRFDLVGIATIAASWIILSPYFAPWAKPGHMPLYAAIGTPNTLLWLWLFVHVWLRRPALRIGSIDITERLHDGAAVVLALAIVTAGMILSSLVQPWGGSAPVVQVVLLFAVLIGSLALAVPAARRTWDAPVRLSAGHVILAVVLVPIYFAAFALTTESTRIVEGLLQH